MKTNLKIFEMRNIKQCTLFVFLVITSFCNAQWVQLGERIDGEYGFDRAGNAVDISADGLTMVIGDRNRKNYPDNFSEAGNARIFKYISGVWQQQGNGILGKEDREHSGHSVSLSADGLTVAIGAPDKDSEVNYSTIGQVRIYKFTGGNWEQQGDNISGDTGDYMGNSVSLSDDGLTVAIGGKIVKTYRSINGNWEQLGNELTKGEYLGYPGYTVALSGNAQIIAIGKAGQYIDGEVKVLKFVDNDWVQQGSTFNDEAYGTQYGVPVSLSTDGLSLAIGTAVTGSAYLGFASVFKFVNDQWIQEGQTIYADRSNDYFGWSVNMSGDGSTLVVGVPYGKNSNNEAGAGVVKVFKLTSGTWEQKGQNMEGKPSDSQGRWGDGLGYAVSISSDGNTVVAGATGLDERFQGYAKIYQFDDATAGFDDETLNMAQVFPNPSKGEITIQLMTPLISDIKIADIHGRVIYNNKIDGSPFKIDLSNFNSGIYFLNVKNEAGAAVKKIVLHK